MSTEPDAAPSGPPPQYEIDAFPEAVYHIKNGFPATVFSDPGGHTTFSFDDSPELRANVVAWQGEDGARFRLWRHATQVLREAMEQEKQRAREEWLSQETHEQRLQRA